MKPTRTAIILVIIGAASILADVANFVPSKGGAYAIAGAILIAAGVLIRSDNYPPPGGV